VSADACWRCEHCEACLAGEYNRCALSGSIGLASDGAFAPRVRFPAYCAVPLPGAVSDRAGALLEPLAVGLHALDRVDARAGETVVVLGSEPGAERRERASQLGYAVHSPDGDRRDVARSVRALTGGGAQIVVDAS